MAKIQPGWYWSRALGQGWYGPFLSMREMLDHAKSQCAKVVYSVLMSNRPEAFASEVIDWQMNETTGDYEERK